MELATISATFGPGINISATRREYESRVESGGH